MKRNPLRDYVDVRFDENGKPYLCYLQWEGQLTPSEARWLLAVTQQYLEDCPSEQDVLHERGEKCGVSECQFCRNREREHLASRISRRNHWQLYKQEPGHVFLVEINGQHRFGTTRRVQQRIKSLERELNEPVRFIHAIETSDRYELEAFWIRHFIDFYVERTGLFQLSPPAINKFRSYTLLEPVDTRPFHYFGDQTGN
ncbi:MAG: hypothetical protein JO316_04630 [Abitibacteriaceae bacterium]|nr:hypothetical protein [Abditibacteriaceae bacterium]